MTRTEASRFESAMAFRASRGQTECGDRHILMASVAGVLAAVVDGLGHGRGAALAAERCIEVLGRFGATDLPLMGLLQRCHEELRGTRGVVMSLAMLDFGRREATWLGVGNVEGRLVKRIPDATGGARTLLLRRGVVGGTLPALQVATVRYGPGDVLLLATDGIEAEFADGLDPADDLQRMVDGIVERYGRRADDALVLAVRHGG